MGIKRTVQSFGNRLLTLPDKSFTWLRNTDAVTFEDDLSPVKSFEYIPVTLSATKGLTGYWMMRRDNFTNRRNRNYLNLCPKQCPKKLAEPMYSRLLYLIRSSSAYGINIVILNYFVLAAMKTRHQWHYSGWDMK